MSDITLATPDYLDILISKNTALQHQLASGRSGRLHSGALSTLKEESCSGEEMEEDRTKEGKETTKTLNYMYMIHALETN